MPPRLISGAILAFWLAMTAWLIEREVVPMMLADASPSYMPNFTDEIGTPTILWFVYHDGNRIGSATSRIVRGPDHTFDFQTNLLFNEKMPSIRQVERSNRVTEAGELRAFKFSITIAKGDTFEIRGKVEAQTLRPRVFYNGMETKLFDLGEIDMGQQGSSVNSMALVNRLRNLHDGQTWTIPPFDPMRNMREKFGGLALLKSFSVPVYIARVKTDALNWHGKQVACYKIEYQEPGKEVTASTWVRRADGLVLQQEAAHFGSEMIVRRAPE
ncbi:MAG: hypothetical protein HYX68_28585 [Planctomycetes bacterium]|nr:hypothetical protein [Planctomycetota bacterium]